MDNSENSIEYKIEQKNKAYYDFLSKENRTKDNNKNLKKRRVKKKNNSFAQKEIHLSDLPIAPKGYESIFYALYILAIPYGFGLTFLSFVLSTSSANNPFLTTDSFLIVWVIGYEVVAVISLIWITILFIKHDPSVV